MLSVLPVNWRPLCDALHHIHHPLLVFAGLHELVTHLSIETSAKGVDSYSPLAVEVVPQVRKSASPLDALRTVVAK